MEVRSNLAGFFKKERRERVDELNKQLGLTESELGVLDNMGALPAHAAEHMAENVVGAYALPFSIATYFTVDGRDYLVPMVIEEPSVVAACSLGAKLARASGGFHATAPEPLMIGQIQVLGCRDFRHAGQQILRHKEFLLERANEHVSATHKRRGGGVRDIRTRLLSTKRGPMLIVHVVVDVRDAMGANLISHVMENLSPHVEDVLNRDDESQNARVLLRILSNLAVERVFTASAVWTKAALEESAKRTGMRGEEIVEAILDAWALADADPYRACTHNKGIMNGIDAVVTATGNDVRAVESAAHAYAAVSNAEGRYGSLTEYEKTPEGDLKGRIAVPLAIGTVGGVTATHPTAKLAMKMLGVQGADELGKVVASVGLAQNFAALRALATEGIQRGHMKLHAKNIAVQSGAKQWVEEIAKAMIVEGNVSVTRAKELLAHKLKCSVQ